MLDDSLAERKEKWEALDEQPKMKTSQEISPSGERGGSASIEETFLYKIHHEAAATYFNENGVARR